MESHGIRKTFESTNPDRPSCSVCDKMEPFKIYDATVTKTSFNIASSGLLLFFRDYVGLSNF